AGRDRGPDAQRPHAERLHDGAGRLAARDDEAAHTLPDQPDGDPRQRLLDERTGALDAELALHVAYLGRLGRRAHQHRPALELVGGPAQRLADDVVAAREPPRVHAELWSLRLPPGRDLRARRDRAAS